MTNEMIKGDRLRRRLVFDRYNIYNLSAMRALVPNMGIENFLTQNRTFLNRKSKGYEPTEEEMIEYKSRMVLLFNKLGEVEGSADMKYHANEWRTLLRSTAILWNFNLDSLDRELKSKM